MKLTRGGVTVERCLQTERFEDLREPGHVLGEPLRPNANVLDEPDRLGWALAAGEQ